MLATAGNHPEHPGNYFAKTYQQQKWPRLHILPILKDINYMFYIAVFYHVAKQSITPKRLFEEEILQCS